MLKLNLWTLYIRITGGLTARQPAAARPKERDYSALLFMEEKKILAKSSHFWLVYNFPNI